MMNIIVVVFAVFWFLPKNAFATKLKYGFTSMTPPCNIPHLVYDTIQDSSVIKCAEYCYSNRYGICGRFLWENNLKTCMLHSTTQYAGSNSITVHGWMILSQINQGCAAVGYDYDPETNTCLKYIRQVGTTWKDARIICQKDGGDLISIQTEQKLNFVLDYSICKFTLWIGLKGTQWLSGDVYTPLVGLTAQLNLHDSRYSTDPEQTCGGLYPYSINQLQDESCNMRTKDGFLCEVIIV